MKRPNGFTLLEVMIVVAIMLLLAAILFPVFRSVRDRAHQAKCASHLRSIGYAMTMYADDHDETLPLGGYSSIGEPNHWDRSWHDSLSWNVRSWGPFFCPASPSWAGYRHSYGVNHFVCGVGWAKKMSEISLPAHTMFVTEKLNGDYAAYAPGEFGNPHWQPLHPRHNGRVHVLFFDSHVEAKEPSDLVVAQVQAG